MSAHKSPLSTEQTTVSKADMQLIVRLIETGITLSQKTHGYSRVVPQAQKALIALRSVPQRS